jgi:hypothetical protein
VKLSIRGCTANMPAVSVTPPIAVMLTGPSLAAAGTMAVIWFGDTTWKAAAAPLKLTAVTESRPLPVIVTASPAAALPGVRPVTCGGSTTVSWAESVNAPSLAVTV